MSRRRVSVKDLGVADCQGWLFRRKEGRSFLGSKWKRCWFVLKKSSLYWYTDEAAEKAEGFINLSDFTVEPAKQCRRKHAITASHPLVVTLFIAADSFTDMNKWIRKLSAAAESCDLINTDECYSEGSDQDGDECVSTSCSLDSDQEAAGSQNGDVLQPLPESATCTWTPTGEDRRSSSSEGRTLSRSRRRRGGSKAPDGGERLSWLDLPDDGAGGGASVALLHDRGEREEEEVVHEKPPDELECLYKHLKAASLSLIGRSSRRDFRASFVRRCQNDEVNEKLHLLRILGSTLKAKQSQLLAVEQILVPSLAAPTYRKWKLSNAVLLQEIARRSHAKTGSV